jgi:hypothetical protein
MAYDPKMLAEVTKLKAQLDAALPTTEEFTDYHFELVERLGKMNLSIGTGGSGGGGMPPDPVDAAMIKQGVVDAISTAAAVAIAPSRRTISTNSTGVVSGGSAAIAADAISYQIISIAGSFTITGDNTTYSASGPLMGVMGDPMVGKKYPAITVAPAINSQIWIEEIR